MLIAFCENNNCREIFLFNLPGMGNVEMIGGKAGPCPNCGGLGIIPDGLYDYVNNQLTFIRGPQISLNTLISVQSLLNKVRNKESSKERVLNEVEKLAPDLAKNFSQIPPGINYHQWI